MSASISAIAHTAAKALARHMQPTSSRPTQSSLGLLALIPWQHSTLPGRAIPAVSALPAARLFQLLHKRQWLSLQVVSTRPLRWCPTATSSQPVVPLGTMISTLHKTTQVTPRERHLTICSSRHKCIHLSFAKLPCTFASLSRRFQKGTQAGSSIQHLNTQKRRIDDPACVLETQRNPPSPSRPTGQHTFHGRILRPRWMRGRD